METPISPVELETLAKNCDIMYYDNLLLNVSKFDHPGGAHFIKQKLGTDISNIFKQTGHSLNAKLMLRDLVVGRIDNQTPKSEMFNMEQLKIVNTYDKVKEKLDLQKPLSEQISTFSRQQFLTFINYPKFIKDGQQLQINPNPKDDIPEKTQFWVNIPILTTIWLILLYFSLSKCQTLNDFLAFSVCFLVAMFKWSIIQYYFHRVKLHKQLDLAETAPDQEFVKLIKSHLLHHAFPNNPKSIVIQLKTIASHLGIICGIYIVFFGTKIALFMATGLIFCVTAYDCLHFFFHFGWQPTWQPIKKLKKNHLKHHFKNTDKGFGVTNTLWDRFFGTQHS